MRKIISIIVILAMVLTMGMSVFAESNVSKEIIDELAGFGIIQGDPDGNLRLNDEISRAEMAKIIMATLGFEGFEPVKTSFSDVDITYWASGYIDAANKNGIISGNGDNTFLPEDNVTNEQAIKMIVCALGYEPMVQSKGGYPFGYMKEASDIGVIKGMNVVGTQSATRGDVTMMIHNAIDIPLMMQTGYGAEIQYTIMDGKNGIELQTIRNTKLSPKKTGGSSGSGSSSIILPTEQSSVPTFTGDEYTGRVLKISNLKKSDGKITFNNCLNSEDTALYIITNDTYVWVKDNTLELNDIADGLYAQCWYYTTDKTERKLLKIEIMTKKPSGI